MPVVNTAFEKYTLSNGLDVILHEDHSIPVVAVNIWYHVGSQNEEPDRTGFAHLFEHIMFKGSKHHNREYFMPLQEVGASINGSTTVDRTNYYENVPSEYLALALWLEADRMGFLLDALDQNSFDVEREVVKNERRQSYENRPYGLAGQEIRKALFPPNHPYNWQTIGSQEHLDAASLEDVKDFFRRFYSPNNASLSIAGDFEPAEARQLVEKYFGDLPPAPPVARIERWLPSLENEVRLNLEDRVQLRRLYFAWVGPPRFDADEAALDVLFSVLSEGRSSRFYRSLVYEKQIARDVNAYYNSMEICGEIRIDATVLPDARIEDVEKAIFDEIERLKHEPPAAEEVERSINKLEAHFVHQLESVGGFGGRADLLNLYNVFGGDPGRLNTDLDRYLKVTPADVQRVAQRYLGEGRVRLVVSPKDEVTPATTGVDRTRQPGPGQKRSFRPPVPQHLQLAGGLDLLVVENHEVPSIAAAVYFPGGSITDPAELPGLSSFMARLLSEGTKNRTSLQIAEESDFIAARPSVGTERESFITSTEALVRHWPRALDLTADMLANPVFPEDEVERVRRERVTDLRRQRDDANGIAERVITGLLYGRDTPYGHPGNGREESIESAPRQSVVDHHARVFKGGRPTFVIVGDIVSGEVASQLEGTFRDWTAEPKLEFLGSTHAKRAATAIYLVDKPGAAQSVIAAGQIGPSRLNPDYLPLVVMNMAFGGQFTARLNMNLREDKGYTYGYRSRFDWRRAASSFIAGGSVQTAVTREALVETLKEFHDLHDQRPITAEEFEKAKLGLIRGYPPTFETPGQVLRRLTDLVHYELPDDYYVDHVARLETVSLADVQRAASEHVDPECLTIVVVGDRGVIEAGMRELDLPIVHLDHEGRPVD